MFESFDGKEDTMQQVAGDRLAYKPANQTDNTKMLTVRFPLELIREMKELARRNDRTVTAEYVRAVRAHLIHNQ